MRSILISFDGHGGPWSALDDGKRWNGAIVPSVTPDVRDAIAAWLRSEETGSDDLAAGASCAAEVSSLPVGPDGRIVIDCGLCFSEVE